MDSTEYYRIETVPGKGRGMYANRDIDEGTVILVEDPLISCQYAWNKKYGYLACDYCMRPLETSNANVRRLLCNDEFTLPFPDESDVVTVKCDDCDEIYCSETCKTTARRMYHELTCAKNDPDNCLGKLMNIWMLLHYPPETCNIMLLIRMIAWYELAENKTLVRSKLESFVQEPIEIDSQKTLSHKILGTDFEQKLQLFRQVIAEHFQSIRTNRNTTTGAALTTTTTTTTITTTAIDHFWDNETVFLRLFIVLARNSQGIGTSPLKLWIDYCKKTLQPQQLPEFEYFLRILYENLEKVAGSFINNEGSGLYAVQSYCNHSCEPNVECRFSGSNFTLSLVALRSIARNEEILLSYLEDCVLERSRHSRRKILRDYYLFECRCVKCEREMPELEADDRTSDEDSDDDDDNDDDNDDDKETEEGESAGDDRTSDKNSNDDDME